MKHAIDLFCGCGGISEGLRLAGYNILAGLDVETNFISTFKHNFPLAQSITQNITELSPVDFANRLQIKPGDLDILAGGPPCQGFSKNVPRKHRYLEDPKNLLVKSFLDYAEYLRPKIILMENVAEMKNGFEGQYTQEIIDRLESSGYNVSHAVLNAADYGVPQRRRRAFFMANREGIDFSIPAPTHTKVSNGDLFSLPSHVNVWDAISDLSPLNHGEGTEISEYFSPPQNDFQKIIRDKNKLCKNHVAKNLKPTQYARISSLEPGQGHKDLPIHLQVKGGYSGAYGRLTKDMVAPTITRWVFHPGSGRWGHPVDLRLLSIREVARMQGFPDSYDFIGSYTQRAGQLGNAVPPLLIYRIICDLEAQIKNQTFSNKSTKCSKEILSCSLGK